MWIDAASPVTRLTHLSTCPVGFSLNTLLPCTREYHTRPASHDRSLLTYGAGRHAVSTTPRTKTFLRTLFPALIPRCTLQRTLSIWVLITLSDIPLRLITLLLFCTLSSRLIDRCLSSIIINTSINDSRRRQVTPSDCEREVRIVRPLLIDRHGPPPLVPGSTCSPAPLGLVLCLPPWVFPSCTLVRPFFSPVRSALLQIRPPIHRRSMRRGNVRFST